MDSICVTMPDNLRDFMMAMAVSQDYQLQLAVGAERKERQTRYQFTFRLDEKFRFFEPSIRVVNNNMPIFDYSGWYEQQRGEYDYYIDFDIERAKSVARNGGKHITGGFNTIVGSGAGYWPIMKYIQRELVVTPELQCDVLIIPWDTMEAERFNQYITKNHPDLEVILDSRSLDIYENMPQNFLTYINCFQIVIGKASALTYVAACLKKTVIEIFPSMEDVMLFGNNALPHYGFIVGDKITADQMWLTWSDVWHELSLSMSNQEQPALTDSQVSIANNADEKSSVQ